MVAIQAENFCCIVSSIRSVIVWREWIHRGKSGRGLSAVGLRRLTSQLSSSRRRRGGSWGCDKRLLAKLGAFLRGSIWGSVGLKGLPKGLAARQADWSRAGAGSSGWRWTKSSGCWLKALIEDGDEVGGKHAANTHVASQTATPPQAIAHVEAFDEVALDESKVAFVLRKR